MRSRTGILRSRCRSIDRSSPPALRPATVACTPEGPRPGLHRSDVGPGLRAPDRVGSTGQRAPDAAARRAGPGTTGDREPAHGVASRPTAAGRPRVRASEPRRPGRRARTLIVPWMRIIVVTSSHPSGTRRCRPHRMAGGIVTKRRRRRPGRAIRASPSESSRPRRQKAAGRERADIYHHATARTPQADERQAEEADGDGPVPGNDEGCRAYMAVPSDGPGESAGDEGNEAGEVEVDGRRRTTMGSKRTARTRGGRPASTPTRPQGTRRRPRRSTLRRSGCRSTWSADRPSPASAPRQSACTLSRA
jgi:hypothetical protein